MAFVAHSKDGKEALIARLRRFVEDSDLSFYEIASRIETSGTILSMWLARTAQPDGKELSEIERFLSRNDSLLTEAARPRSEFVKKSFD